MSAARGRASSCLFLYKTCLLIFIILSAKAAGSSAAQASQEGDQVIASVAAAAKHTGSSAQAGNSSSAPAAGAQAAPPPPPLSGNSSMSASQPLASSAMMSGNSSQTFMLAGGQTAGLGEQARGQQQQQQQGGKASGAAKTSAGRQQPAAAASAASASPAHNSRQLKQQAASPARSKAAHQTAGGADNQMAADDAHETQAALAPAGAASRELDQEHELARMRELRLLEQQRQQQQQAAAVQQMASAGQQQQQPYKQQVGKTAGAAPSWQTVSASIAAPSAAGAPWRPSAGSGQSSSLARHLPPPPPPVGYNGAHSARQQQQLEQMMQQLGGAGELEAPASQLERPGAGYSYGPGAYTHTTQLARPHHQEGATKQLRQRQFAPTTSAGEQAAAAPGRSSGAAHEQLKQGAGQLAQFSAAQFQQQSQAASGAAPFARPAPQLSVTNTPASPCRPPAPLSHAALQQQQLLLGNSGELLAGGASSSPGVSVLPAARYLRAAAGTRLRSQFVFKVLWADSLTDCELACSRASLLAANNPLDACRSFNYRAHFAAENCELSRLELRALKLDDGAQFEPHTQFDFYALDSGAATGGAPSAAAMFQQQQQQQESECLDVSQACSQEGMEFTLRTSEPFHGRLYTYGFYDSCFFDGDGATTSVLRISRPNGFPRCGTQLIGDLMTNLVVVQFNDFVQTTRDKKYNLTCYFSGPSEAVVTSNYLDTKLDERNHPTQIEHLPPQNVVTSNVHLRVLYRGQPTNTIAVGDLLTFRLETGATGGKLARAQELGAAPMNEIFATNVIAKDPYSGRQVQLIDARGCPVDPLNVFPELQRTPDGALESEFYAFKIPDSNFLIFQATVRTCKSPCEPVICHTHATGATLERPPGTAAAATTTTTTAAVLGGVKGAAQTLGAYLMAPHQSSAPSWGKRKRRRRRRKRQSELEGAADELTGESVEHVIPVRGGAGHAITSVRRPELSEAEEEVKEMFRVYLTRAEINKQLRRPAANLTNAPAVAAATAVSPGVEWGAHELAAWTRPAASIAASGEPAEPLELAPRAPDHVCLTSAGYYAMLFAIIALTLVVLAILAVALLVTRKAKFRISDTLADSMF